MKSLKTNKLKKSKKKEKKHRMDRLNFNKNPKKEATKNSTAVKQLIKSKQDNFRAILTQQMEKFEKYLKPLLFEQINQNLEVFKTRLQYEAVNSYSDAQKKELILEQLEKMNVSLVSKMTNSLRDCLDQELASITKNIATGALGSVKPMDMHTKLSGFMNIGKKKLFASNFGAQYRPKPDNNQISHQSVIEHSNERNMSNLQYVGGNHTLEGEIGHKSPGKTTGLQSAPMVQTKIKSSFLNANQLDNHAQDNFDIDEEESEEVFDEEFDNTQNRERSTVVQQTLEQVAAHISGQLNSIGK